MPTPVVVGAGISGIACALALAERGYHPLVLDRGRRVGGRMATRAIRDSGTALDGHAVDIGASYFTVRDPKFRALVDQMLRAGVIREWTNTFHVAEDGAMRSTTGPMRYTAARGIRTVVEFMADQLPDPCVSSGVEVETITLDSGRLVVNGTPADAIALCLPGPQALRILDAAEPTLQQAISAAADRTWEPVIAVTTVYDERCWEEFDAVFVNGDPTLSWIANDGSRRGTGAPVLVSHLTPTAAVRHLEEPSGAIEEAVISTRRTLSIDAEPIWASAQRWTFARPTDASPEPCFLDPDISLGLAGDAWAGGPRVEAAWMSGAALGGHLAARLDGRR